MFEPEVINISEINFDNLDDNNGFSSSSNFGGGIELLMNDKKKSSSGPSSDINIDDLNNLEDELNNLASEPINISSNDLGSGSSGGLFGSSLFGSSESKPSVRFNDGPSIGASTANTADDSKSWDGYGKFNNVPINPDKPINTGPQLSKEEMLREKFKYLRKLEALEKKGVELTKKYTMESSLLEMQGEYEMIMEEKSRQNSVKFQGQMMMALINGLEFLNNRFDPFDVKLDGWGEQINENITDYDDIFGELHDKYKSKASMSPELKLLFQLGGSAMMVHMTNTMFKSAMPGMDDILRQNPDLMRSFQSAAVNSMSGSNPGFAGFMGGMMSPNGEEPPKGRGPPAPLATQGLGAERGRGGNNAGYSSRPDLASASSNDGINFRESFPVPSGAQPAEKSRRPEMKGPSDITDILSGLKTKTINIQEPQIDANDSSTISISDLTDLQGSGNVPKKSRRKQKSDKNTVSLDI